MMPVCPESIPVIFGEKKASLQRKSLGTSSAGCRDTDVTVYPETDAQSCNITADEIFCFAGAYSVNENYFDVGVALVFTVLAWVLRKMDLPPVPILLGLVLGKMTETNFRRALLVSDGDPGIFFSSIYCKIFVVLIIVALAAIIRGKIKDRQAEKAARAE